MSDVKFDQTIWGPHYWFFLNTVAESYPNHPNAVTKRKYYDLIQNMPLFIPVPDMGDTFAEMLDKYPVTPYLDCRESFVRWVHFIHNKFNTMLGKKEMSSAKALDTYRAEYKPKPIYLSETIRMRRHYLYISFILILCFLIYWYY